MAPMPMKPPIGIGTGSVIQRTTTPEQHRGQRLLLVVDAQWQQEQHDRDQWREHQPDRAATLLEPLLALGELLLAEAAVGRRSR